VITVVDYGMGNVGSILNMLRHMGVSGRIASTASALRDSAKLILPGVGSFDAGMQSLASSGLLDAIKEKVIGEKTPLLGICLGMQLLTRRSEEGQLPGLGWIDADTIRWRFDPKATSLKIPHMGWNVVKQQNGAPMFTGFSEPPRFYFVHSYHLVCDNPADVAGTVLYGYEAVAAVARRHIMGVQFHPEKSHSFGMRLLEYFANWQPPD
jgi:glutamine amidotransferase